MEYAIIMFFSKRNICTIGKWYSNYACSIYIHLLYRIIGNHAIRKWVEKLNCSK